MGIGVKLVTVGVLAVGLVHFHMLSLNFAVVDLLSLVVSKMLHPLAIVVNVMALHMGTVDSVAIPVFVVDVVVVSGSVPLLFALKVVAVVVVVVNVAEMGVYVVWISLMMPLMCAVGILVACYVALWVHMLAFRVLAVATGMLVVFSFCS